MENITMCVFLAKQASLLGHYAFAFQHNHNQVLMK